MTTAKLNSEREKLLDLYRKTRPEIDESAMSVEELAREMKASSNSAWKWVKFNVGSGLLEEVRKHNESGRMVKAYRVRRNK